MWWLKRTAIKSSGRGCKKLFRNKYFWPKIFQKPLFLSFLVEKWQRQKFLIEFFLIGIDSEWPKTYLKVKIAISKIFSSWPSSGDIAIFSENGSISRKNCKDKKFLVEFFLVGINSEWSKMHKSKKWLRQKIFGRNFFLSESIQNGPKRILKWKSQFQKLFSLWPSGDIAIFSKNWGHKSKKWETKKFLVEEFFWSESIQNGPKRILKWKSQFRKFFPTMNLLWGHSHFSKNGAISRKNSKDKNFLIKKFFVQNFRLTPMPVLLDQYNIPPQQLLNPGSTGL